MSTSTTTLASINLTTPSVDAVDSAAVTSCDIKLDHLILTSQQLNNAKLLIFELQLNLNSIDDILDPLDCCISDHPSIPIDDHRALIDKLQLFFLQNSSLLLQLAGKLLASTPKESIKEEARSALKSIRKLEDDLKSRLSLYKSQYSNMSCKKDNLEKSSSV